MTPFAANLADFISQARCVKSNPVRQVFYRDGKYLKLDRRRRHGFAGEFASAKLLQTRGVPVVEHLEYGASPLGNYLLTAEFAGAVTVEEFCRDRTPGREFLVAFGKFLNLFCASGLWHGDFHLGNILYRPADGAFALVDVHAVHRNPLLRRWCGDRLRHPVIELRNVLTDSELFTLLKWTGVSDPEAFFLKTLKTEARRLHKEWPRRREQVLSGYAKFTCKEGNVLYASRLPVGEYATCTVEGENAEAAFLFHFFLELARIPHFSALSYDAIGRRTQLAAPPADATAAPAAAFSEMRRRMRALGIISKPEEWRHVPGGVLPKLVIPRALPGLLIQKGAEC